MTDGQNPSKNSTYAFTGLLWITIDRKRKIYISINCSDKWPFELLAYYNGMNMNMQHLEILRRLISCLAMVSLVIETYQTGSKNNYGRINRQLRSRLKTQ